MNKELFSPMAIDAIGEMMNISLGSSATAVSNMLDHRVEITTPRVSVVNKAEFTLGEIDPALGVKIEYVEGLQGSNIMLLKKSDVKVIVEILMGTEIPDEEFELGDLTISAVCELMNQMMGAASTAMSDFLGYLVNISTPEPFELDDLEKFKQEHLPTDSENMVIVRFFLKIDNILESEFMNVMSVSLAQELLIGLGLGDGEEGTQPPAPQQVPPPVPTFAQQGAAQGEESGGSKLSQEEIERLMSGASEPAQQPQTPTQPPSATHEDTAQSGAGGAKLTQEEIEKMISGAADEMINQHSQPQQQQLPPQMPHQQMQNGAQSPEGGYIGYPPAGYYPPYPYPYPYPYPPQPEAKKISTQPLEVHPMEHTTKLDKEQAENLDLIMNVPLQVTVEIGRTRRKVQDVLQFSKGALVVLDKLAGDQVDLFVNGKCIAKGDVVVVDDNFGVRITEILQKPSVEDVAP